MSKLTGIDDVAKKGADVISFGARRLEMMGKQARERMATQGFQSSIPGAEGWSKMMDTDQIIEMTYPRDTHTVGVIDNDVMYRLSHQFGEPFDEDLGYIDTLVQGVGSPRGDDITFVHRPPTFEGRWNPETLDFEFVVSYEELLEARAYKMLRTQDPNRFNDNGMPFEIEWGDDAPWFLGNEDWQHSGRVKFVDEEGLELMTLRTDELEFPFDADIKARKSDEVSAQWWSNNPVTAWVTNGKATSKYQASTDREVTELLRTLYSPSQEEWFNLINDDPTSVGRMVREYITDNGVNVSDKQWSALRANHVDTINDFLSGQIDPRVSATDVINENGTDEMRRILSGRAVEARRKADIEVQIFAGSELVDAPMDWITNHFNVTMARMRESDPVRYQQMLDFVADSPYRQGNIWPGAMGDDHPMLIFHSGRALDMEAMGRGDVEMGQFLTPREAGLHTGDLLMSAPFGNYHVTTSSRSRSGLSTSQGDFPTHTDKAQEMRVNEIWGTMPMQEARRYEEAASEIFAEWLSKMTEEVPGSGQFRRPDLGQMILNRMDPDLARLADYTQPALDDATIARLADKFLSHTATYPRRELQGLAAQIEAHASIVYSQAGQATWPLVFRGKRPFKIKDVTGNTPRTWAGEALKHPGISNNPEWRQRLESIRDGVYEGTPQERAALHKEASEGFRQVLEEAGFDHVIYINTADLHGKGRPAIVFWDQSLAKPLYGSKGFDKNSRSWANGVIASPLVGFKSTEERQEQ